jgi:glucose-6-phosphate isomerase
MMPYSSKLKDFSFWFVQLWAESLGKYSKAKSMPVGLTPIPAYGATDQHAQMQLFMEGPNNKCIFLISIEKRINDFKLDSNLELESAEKLKKYTMNELLEAEHQGTLMALKQNSRNTISIKMDTLNEQNLGALIIFFESLTCMMGHYFKIDPFNQPGVEKGKKYTFEYLHSLRK